MNELRISCPYCDRQAALVGGNVVYPHREDLFNRKYWHCAPCDAYVGVHRRNKKHGFTGVEPLGRLANAELRRWKQRAHAAFDPLWRSKELTRTEAYAWLAGALGISIDNTHIGIFDVEGCKAVVAAVVARKEEDRTA